LTRFFASSVVKERDEVSALDDEGRSPDEEDEDEDTDEDKKGACHAG
jgi:hypothetical protein